MLLLLVKVVVMKKAKRDSKYVRTIDIENQCISFHNTAFYFLIFY